MKKILIVDDDHEIVDLVKSRLEGNHFNVVSASDGKSGVAAAEKENPDLILMDVMMPNMPGGEAVRLLKASEKTKHIPIIFLTAVASSRNPMGEEDKGINISGEYYPAIGKPFESIELLATIHRCMK